KVPTGGMGEVSHIDARYHVNKTKDVVFKDGGSYDPNTKKCSNTKCHKNGTDPVWGGSVNSTMTCLNCHGTNGPDKDKYVFSKSFNNNSAAKINLTEWGFSGHGRFSTAGRYPVSNNPAANFSGNPCWYCHDNNVLHNVSSNRFRLRLHSQYERRFEKECVYCHTEGKDAECVSCHRASTQSLAPQLRNITSSGIRYALWSNNSTVRKTDISKSPTPRPTHQLWSSSSSDAWRPSCLSQSDSNNI